MVHNPKCAFKVGVRCVNVLFGKFGVLVHCDVSREAIIYVSVGSEPVRGVAKYALGLRRLGPNGGEDRHPNLENAVHEVDWAVVCRVVRVGFVGLVY